MSCRNLEKFNRGKIGREALEGHAGQCPECADALRLDAEILDRAASLRRPVQAPQLWERIERGLREQSRTETLAGRDSRFARSRTSPGRWLAGRLLRPLPAAALAVAIAAIGVGGFHILQGRTPSSGLMSDRVLARVEKAESDYTKAVEALAAQSKPKLDKLEIEIAFLYRERLAVIDTQIERCRNTLERNPANAHIHSYLLAALKDKRATLTEILNRETV